MAQDKHKPAHRPLRAASGDAQDSREALIAAGKAIFARKGFDGATVKDIADEAGVNVSLVSYYFGGKEGLYKTALEEFGKARLDAAERMLKPAPTLAEFELRIRLFAEEFLESHLREPDLCSILHRDFDGANAVALELFQGTFLKMFERFCDFLRAGQAAGYLKADLDPEISAMLVFGGLVHNMRIDAIRKAFRGETIADPAFRARLIEAFAVTSARGLAVDSAKVSNETKTNATSAQAKTGATE